MKALKRYVDQKNVFRVICKQPKIVIPRANSHPVKRLAKAKIIFDLLAGDLSPENLHCDGEISNAAARKKATAFNTAWKQLETIIGRHFDEIELYS